MPKNFVCLNDIKDLHLSGQDNLEVYFTTFDYKITSYIEKMSHSNHFYFILNNKVTTLYLARFSSKTSYNVFATSIVFGILKQYTKEEFSEQLSKTFFQNFINIHSLHPKFITNEIYIKKSKVIFL